MQTSITIDPPVAVEGMLAYGMSDHPLLMSAVCEVATGIKAGRFLTLKASTVRGADLPDAAADITGPDALGISVLLSGREPYSDGVHYHENDLMTYVRRGYIWVKAETPVVAGDLAFVRHVAAGAEELGRFRHDADGGGPDATSSPCLVWRSTTTGNNELAILEVNLPGKGS